MILSERQTRSPKILPSGPPAHCPPDVGHLESPLSPRPFDTTSEFRTVPRHLIGVGIALLLCLAPAFGREAIRLPNNPALSPDGQWLAFDWNGDIWLSSSAGGLARPLTNNPAKDTQPKFSPDGKEIAFVSDREGTPQVFVMPVTGGTPTQVTFHTAGYTLNEWLPDGSGWLVTTTRDNGWGRRNNDRLQIVRRWTDINKRPADEMLFDDYATSGTLSPDGKTVLFTREGPEWWRKGYKGSQSAQLWSYDRVSKVFSKLETGAWDSRWPLWGPGNTVWYANGAGGCFNIWQMDRNTKQLRQITTFKDDSAVFPAISRDGGTMVFRNLFDLYLLKTAVNAPPAKIELFRDDDRPADRIDRKALTTANYAAFSSDGLDVAFVAGGDLWVMDTELKEPKRITKTPEEERAPIFSPDGQAIFFISDAGGKPEIWKATKAEGNKPWFLTNKFQLDPITNDGFEKRGLSFSPEGSKFAYVEGRGNLIVCDADGKNPKKVIASWDAPDYDWSPDGKWIVYAQHDSDFNRDIWVMPIDGSKPPFNISRHPYNESDPVWSPDGKIIAFVGERDDKDRTDIHYVYLRAQDEEKTARDRAMEKALEKYLKGRVPGFKSTDPMPMPKADPAKSEDADEQAPKKEDAPAPMPMPVTPTPKKGLPEVVIDFEGIHDRIHRVSIPNANESNLFWSPDSKKLAFSAPIDGTAATYTIEIPENLKPTQISSQTGVGAKWLKNGSIVWLSGGKPGSFTAGAPTPATPSPATGGPRPGGPGGPRGGAGGGAGGSAPTAGAYSFTAFQDIDTAKKHQAAFDMCWRQMRDNWYDERMGNRDWNKVREKYRGVAETADQESLTTIVQLMLGELNGSHLGFFAGTTTLPTRRPGGPPEEPGVDRNWRYSTAHLGVRFETGFPGPGLKVKDVLPESPADHKKSKLNIGDVILSIDGVPADPTLDPTLLLNVPPGKEFTLKVKNPAGGEREVVLRPITYTAARQLLYQKWLQDNRTMVDKLSKGTLGYLHINAMDMASFHKFQEELYNAGAGKDGLVIDVRENGGGSTADLLLTALTQPQHAIAVPRGGGPGYPQDRTVFATWSKPIVVLCNQNSFSNAEIFSHAIKVLKRGRLVGVPTAGGVVSTGGTGIMDVGFLRMPFRGWFNIDTGEDQELNGAVPEVIVWPVPGEAAMGKDVQMEKGVELLMKDVEIWKNRPTPKLRKATER